LALALPLQAVAMAAEGAVGLNETATRLAEWSLEGDSPPPDVLKLRTTDREQFRARWDTFRTSVPSVQQDWRPFLSELSRLPKAESRGFRVLTVDAARGREFRAVAILGMNQGSFPDVRSVNLAALEGERRLAYVAMTRAALVLRLSRPLVRA